MHYIPNAYFVYFKDNEGRYFWHLKLCMGPNIGTRTIVSGAKKRENFVKVVNDIENFKLKYGIVFLCNCYILSHSDYLHRSIRLERIPTHCNEVK